VVDTTLGYRLGQRFAINDRPFLVVGIGRHLTMNGGTPNAYVALSDVQQLLLRGAPMATAILVGGRPESVPPGFRVMSQSQVRDDIVRLNVRVLKAMDTLRGLLWAVTAGIIGTLVYLSALERTRDFAVFKATGASSASLFGGLALQAALIAGAAAILSVGLAHLLVPLFPVPIIVSNRAVALLPVVAIGIGLLASALSLRRAVAVDPALAFAGG
jgi:putative ABC transport system permease protein